jgi:hypothetical protein
MARSVLAAAAAAALAAGCGGSTPSSSPTFGSDTLPAAKALTGVVVIQSDAQTGKDVGEPHVTVGLYLAPIHSGGPIAVDPPQPVMQVTTDGQGGFRFTGVRPGKRYYVFASGAKGYTIGRWATAGDHVRLTVCTNCVMPL